MPTFEEGVDRTDDQLRKWQIAAEIEEIAHPENEELKRVVKNIKDARLYIQKD